MIVNLYRADDWYWIVADSTTQVYSSARAQYVATNDATYLRWLSLVPNQSPTRIASEADLWDVLAAQFPAGIGAAGQGALKDRLISNLDNVALKVAFNHENRIRALESKAPVTLAQFTAAVKALL